MREAKFGARTLDGCLATLDRTLFLSDDGSSLLLIGVGDNTVGVLDDVCGGNAATVSWCSNAACLVLALLVSLTDSQSDI